MTNHNLKIERGIAHGNSYLTVTLDGVETDGKLSRKLTGTTNESGSGVFGERSDRDFWYGNITQTFHWSEIDYRTHDVQTIAAELSRRIREVRAWVASCDHSETLTATITL